MPEELWLDFDAIVGLLSDAAARRLSVVADAVRLCEGRTMKEIGLCDDVPESAKWAVFAMRNGRSILTDRFSEA